MKASVRGSDYTCRHGGEEFLFVLPDAPLDGARLHAEALRLAVDKAALDGPGGERIAVTLSIGVAAFPDHAADTESLLSAADAALYEAKRSGRNRVVVSSANAVLP